MLLPQHIVRKVNGYAMPIAWRVEGRANGFVPWFVIGHFADLDDAVRAAEGEKRKQRLYASRVRAN